MPIIANTADNIIDEKDITLSPQSVGIYPPTTEPTNMPIQISDFDIW